eukprot:134192-Prymnesium_polylepis.1
MVPEVVGLALITPPSADPPLISHRLRRRCALTQTHQRQAPVNPQAFVIFTIPSQVAELEMAALSQEDDVCSMH